ncbi:putative RNA-directed DNA polymerase [Aphis craccivora]|uniref:Putative RNA-directed DNA polymerase n=1 Tax=Aphis craccivora TaxID=307492 RepID=A0A6G0Z4D3_APHCR|nr:putative RNA-directed DNA polymerase [Aphis craccivora]
MCYLIKLVELNYSKTCMSKRTYVRIEINVPVNGNGPVETRLKSSHLKYEKVTTWWRSLRMSTRTTELQNIASIRDFFINLIRTFCYRFLGGFPLDRSRVRARLSTHTCVRLDIHVLHEKYSSKHDFKIGYCCIAQTPERASCPTKVHVFILLNAKCLKTLDTYKNVIHIYDLNKVLKDIFYSYFRRSKEIILPFIIKSSAVFIYHLSPDARNDIIYSSHCEVVKTINTNFPDLYFVIIGDYNLSNFDWSTDPANQNHILRISLVPKIDYHHPPLDIFLKFANSKFNSTSECPQIYNFNRCDFNDISNFLSKIDFDSNLNNNICSFEKL